MLPGNKIFKLLKISIFPTLPYLLELSKLLEVWNYRHPITVNLMRIKQNFADLSYKVYVRSYELQNTSHLFPPTLGYPVET